ncbi:MAG: hypothetical protein KGH95_06095 [Thaumarchaeota archaeon]|nr:hypothetical protein [Nitrososphaerota archaeon]
MKKQIGMIITLVVIGFALNHAYADSVPSWVKNDAKWWSEDQMVDKDFVNAMQYLIQNNIIKIPASQNTNTTKSDHIPKWVKTNAGSWASDSITTSEFVSGLQYLIDGGIIQISSVGNQPQGSDQTQSSNTTSMNANQTQLSNMTSVSSETTSCDNEKTPADKQTCLDNLENQKQLEAKMASSTPYQVGPVTYYLVGTDAINTGDGEMIIIHTILENSQSPSSNPDLFCTGPFACNYHLSDGQADYPPSIFSLTSGHLELVYNKPVVIDWNFYSKENVGGFNFDQSKQYYFKIEEPFGSQSIPLKLNLQ